MDRLSKKLLRYMNKEHSKKKTNIFYEFSSIPEEMVTALKADPDVIIRAAAYLHQKEYIAYALDQFGHERAFFLDHKGLHWKEFHHRDLLRYVADHWIEFFSMLISCCALVLSLISLLSGSPASAS